MHEQWARAIALAPSPFIPNPQPVQIFFQIPTYDGTAAKRVRSSHGKSRHRHRGNIGVSKSTEGGESVDDDDDGQQSESDGGSRGDRKTERIETGKGGPKSGKTGKGSESVIAKEKPGPVQERVTGGGGKRNHAERKERERSKTREPAGKQAVSTSSRTSPPRSWGGQSRKHD
jgi:hypothetical protein